MPVCKSVRVFCWTLVVPLLEELNRFGRLHEYQLPASIAQHECKRLAGLSAERRVGS